MAGRINTLDYTYIDIAIKSYIEFHKAEKILNNIEEKYKVLKSEDDFNNFIYERLQPRESLIQSYITTVIFVSLAIEAYIYDLGASNISDEYVLDHLDKLGIIDKWIIIPRLVFNSNMDKSQKWFELLKKIVYTRNNFVHSKSKDLDYERFKEDKTYREKNSIVYNPKYILADETIILLSLLDNELIKNDKNKTLNRHLFNKEHYKEKYPEFF
jgi:hypothetical protein